MHPVKPASTLERACFFFGTKTELETSILADYPE